MKKLSSKVDDYGNWGWWNFKAKTEFFYTVFALPFLHKIN